MRVAPRETSFPQVLLIVLEETYDCGLYEGVRVSSSRTNRLAGSADDDILNTGSRPSPPSDFGRRCFGRFRAASSATDIPPVPGDTVLSSATRISRLRPSIRTPNVRLEEPVVG